MNAEIIAVGSELLLGQIANTNAQFLSERLSNLGINVYYHSVVGDNEKRLKDCIQHSMKRADILIITGGLGPTKDDLTKETVAQVLQKKLTYDEGTLKQIEQFFQRRNSIMTENNRKQALVLEGATVFPNHHGLACGMGMEVNKKLFVLLPGPPKELKPMFDEHVIPYLRRRVKDRGIIQSRILRFFHIGESQLVHQIDDILETQTNPTIAPLASDNEVTLRLTVKGTDEVENNQLLDEVEEKILERVGTYFYGYGETNIVEQLVNMLKKEKKKVASAESLTGGLFATQLTNYPGISSVFDGSIVCYSNDIKEKIVGVPRDLIENEGVVSARCAEQLAYQIRLKMNSDFGISFTGVAGPDKLEGKQPGTVFIGISSREKTKSYQVNLAGSRENIRERTVKYGAYYLLQWIRMEKVNEKNDEV